MTNQQTASSAGGDARPTGDSKQIANQAKQLANDAQALKGQLQQGGVKPQDLKPVDDVIKALKDMTNEKALQNPKGLQDLYTTAVEKFKLLEFEIRKRVDTTNEQLFLSGSDDVPPSFRTLIEQYYKSLNKKPAGPGGGGGK